MGSRLIGGKSSGDETRDKDMAQHESCQYPHGPEGSCSKWPDRYVACGGQPRIEDMASNVPLQNWLRLQARKARRLAEESDMPARRLADTVGYANVDRFRRAFGRRLGVSLVEYRKRFAG